MAWIISDIEDDARWLVLTESTYIFVGNMRAASQFKSRDDADEIISDLDLVCYCIAEEVGDGVGQVHTARKTCSHCRVDLPIDRFYKCSATPDMLQNICKSCAFASTKKHQKLRASVGKCRLCNAPVGPKSKVYCGRCRKRLSDAMNDRNRLDRAMGR